jgi:hypothetical protein
MDEQDWRRLATEWFPHLVDHRLRQVSWPSIEPHRDYIAAQLRAEVTVVTIHQRLRDEHGLDASVASLRRWVRANLPEQARRARVTVLGECPPPGEQAQIDYGRLGMWLDPATGRRRAVWAFVMVLPCSRHLFVRPTLVMDQAKWTAAHVEAFAFFGGVPARLVLEYVPRNIFRVLWPRRLCGRRRQVPGADGVRGRRRSHNDQSVDSQRSRASSDFQTGRGRGSSEAPGGSVCRSASIFALVLISA